MPHSATEVQRVREHRVKVLKIFGRSVEVSMAIILLGLDLAVLFVLLLQAQEPTEFLLLLSALATTLMVGVFLVRNTFHEAGRREEIRQLATDLYASNKRLRRLDELKTSMVSITSHQIRGPLGGIRGYLAMFRDGDLGPLTEKQKEIVKLNLNVTSRLLNSVETFLDITMLESGKLTLRKEVLPLDDAVAGVVEEFKLPAEQKGLGFSFTVSCPRPVMADFDPEKLKHAIFNLVDNAMKYTDQGKIEVRLRCEGREAVIEVNDTGMGIPPGDHSSLFGKFERGELVIDRGGSGLGLYVVKMLAEMHGGRVSAASAGVGQGSTFSMSLPLARL